MKLFILLAITLMMFVTNPALSSEISGSIVKGLRILDVDSKTTTLNYKVYRGDYIKFRYPKELGKMKLNMPQMKYKHEVDGNIEASKYFKMKKTGNFKFTLGKKIGTIAVIEYDRPNYKAISAEKGHELIKTIQPLILDVRTPGEYQRAHIKGSKLIPVSNLQHAYKEIEEYKNQDILIYCASGNRSTVASKILADHGFKRIYNLRYGIGDWYQRGYPITK